MRIVAVADTHTFHHELTIPDGDVFVHAGDLCRIGKGLHELEHAADWLHALPHPTKIVVAGNHDRMFLDRPERARAVLADRGIRYLQDSGTEVAGVTFWGSPWQPEFNDWAFNCHVGGHPRLPSRNSGAVRRATRPGQRCQGAARAVDRAQRWSLPSERSDAQGPAVPDPPRHRLQRARPP
ncbi:metallophosphoesterase [Spirillospora sp. CA-255316]